MPVSVSAKNMVEFITVEKHLLSRLLYSNPVCILGTVSSAGKPNAMTVSWLTCINNSGVIFLSINEKRHSASIIKETQRFSLGIAVDGMQSTLLEVGGKSGRDSDKTDSIDELNPCNIDGSLPWLHDSWIYFDVFLIVSYSF
jgi:flavin reductase (DIM6/NTAB) family NADH-FMN oxidoreductase RutF